MGNQHDGAHDQNAIAISILAKVGAIKKCDDCGNSYVDGDKSVENAYAYATKSLTKYLGDFKDRKELLDAIQSAYADNSSDECSECTPQEND